MDQSNRKDYWEAYYKNGGPSISECSSFAMYCLPYIDVKKILFDMGCGSGRDALFFLQNDIPVIAVDKSVEAVGLAKRQADFHAPDKKDKVRLECPYLPIAERR
jgi:cyclopropane fatty-acyl-phospholipid synthase-like methyltransferase